MSFISGFIIAITKAPTQCPFILDTGYMIACPLHIFYHPPYNNKYCYSEKSSIYFGSDFKLCLCASSLIANTPQPNRSKVFELQQSNQGYGELKGVEEVQKNAKQKYSTELIWRTATLKSLKSMTICRYLKRYLENGSKGQKKLYWYP